MDHEIAIIDNAIPDIRSPVLFFSFKYNCPMFSFAYALKTTKMKIRALIVKQFFNIKRDNIRSKLETKSWQLQAISG
jgi:hypothetical protein